MPFLVSLCNLGSWLSRYPVAVADGDLASAAFLDCDAFMLPDADTGITGITAYRGDLLLCVQSAMPRLVRLDPYYDVRAVYPLAEALDPHSVCIEGATALIASSRRNRVIALDLETGVERCRFVADEADRDTVHLNSLAIWNGRLAVSMLGRRGNDGRRAGCVVTEDGDVIAANLAEPHSLTVADGRLLFLESAAGTCVEAGGTRSVVAGDGYLRGLCVEQDRSVFGRSALRHERHGAGNAYGGSALMSVDRQTGTVSTLDLTPLGPEIYDILSVAEPPPAERLFGDAETRRHETRTLAKRHSAARGEPA